MEQQYQTNGQAQQSYAQTQYQSNPQTQQGAASYTQGQQYAQANYTQGQQYVQNQTQPTSDRPNYPQADQNMYNSPHQNVQQSVSSPLTQSLASWFDYRNNAYLKGLLVGVGATLIATNPAVQRAIVKGAVTVWGGIQSSVEEIKEQVEDIKAEIAER